MEGQIELPSILRESALEGKDKARAAFLEASLLELNGFGDAAIELYKTAYKLEIELQFFTGTEIEIKGVYYGLQTGKPVEKTSDQSSISPRAGTSNGPIHFLFFNSLL